MVVLDAGAVEVVFALFRELAVEAGFVFKADFTGVEPGVAERVVPAALAVCLIGMLLCTCAGLGLGLEVAADERAFEMLDAVGLLSRSAASGLRVWRLTGTGGTSCAPFAFARDAAVGANRPDAGVRDRVAPAGVCGRAEGMVAGVLGRAADAGVRGVLIVDGVLGREGVVGPCAAIAVEARGLAEVCDVVGAADSRERVVEGVLCAEADAVP